MLKSPFLNRKSLSFKKYGIKDGEKTLQFKEEKPQVEENTRSNVTEVKPEKPEPTNLKPTKTTSETPKTPIKVQAPEVPKITKPTKPQKPEKPSKQQSKEPTSKQPVVEVEPPEEFVDNSSNDELNSLIDEVKKKLDSGSISGIKDKDKAYFFNRIHSSFNDAVDEYTKKWNNYDVALEFAANEVRNSIIPELIEILGGKEYKSKEDKKKEELEEERKDKLNELVYDGDFGTWYNELLELSPLLSLPGNRFRDEIENVFLNNYDPKDSGESALEKVKKYATETIDRYKKEYQQKKEQLAKEIKGITDNEENKKIVDEIGKFSRSDLMDDFQSQKEELKKILLQTINSGLNDVESYREAMDEFEYQYNPIVIEFEENKKSAHGKLKQLMELKDYVKLEPKFTGGDRGHYAKVLGDTIFKGIHFVESITSGLQDDRWIGFDWDWSGRANYSSAARIIRLSEKHTPSTVVHELGHHVEEKPGVKELAIKFLKHRVGNEKPTHMADVANGSMIGEYGRKDDFGKFFTKPSDAYYVGKVYGTVQNPINTEIISMGLQALYDDPVGFCSKDPGYAAFIIHCLKM